MVDWRTLSDEEMEATYNPRVSAVDWQTSLLGVEGAYHVAVLENSLHRDSAELALIGQMP